MEIIRKDYKLIPFSSLKPGEAFVLQDKASLGNICMKIKGSCPNAVALNTGECGTITDKVMVHPVECEVTMKE